MSVTVHRQDVLQETPTVSQSLNVVKNLISTSIGSLCYIRNIFPEAHFKDTSMNGVIVKKFKDKSHDIFNWIERGAYDAIEKKYLKTLEFGIYSVNKEDKIETYEFNFSYPNDGSYCMAIHSAPEVKLTTKREITKATTELLRRLLTLTQILEPLPEHINLTMRLLYYPHTPADYEPPHFVPGEDEDGVKNRMETIQIGNVNTPFHCLNVTIKTVKQSDNQEHDIMPMNHERDEDEVDPFSAPIEPDTQSLMNELSKGSKDCHHENHVVTTRQQQKQMNPASAFRMPETPISNKKNEDKNERRGRQRKSIRNPIPPSSPSETGDIQMDTQQLHTCATQDVPHDDDMAVAISQENFYNNNDDDNMSPMMLDDQGNNLETLLNDSQDRLTRSRFSMLMMTPQKEGQIQESEDIAHVEGPMNVKCCCGVDHPDGDMIQCEACGNWNHISCAGFMGQSDQRLDTYSHVCYDCLIAASQAQTNHFISDLMKPLLKAIKSYRFFYPNEDVSKLFQQVCLIRRAWYRMYNEPDAFASIHHIRTSMGVTFREARSLRDKLVEEKVLIPSKTQTGKNRGFSVQKTKSLQKRFESYWMTNMPLLQVLRTDSIQAFADPFVPPKVSTTKMSLAKTTDLDHLNGQERISYKKRTLPSSNDHAHIGNVVKRRKVSVVAKDLNIR